MTKSRLPLSAFDPRLFDLWRRGTLRRHVLGVADPSSPDFDARARALATLMRTLNEARAVARRDSMPGHEDLFRAVLRIERHRGGKITRLTVEPREAAIESLLSGVGLDRELENEITMPLVDPSIDILAEIVADLGGQSPPSEKNPTRPVDGIDNAGDLG